MAAAYPLYCVQLWNLFVHASRQVHPGPLQCIESAAQSRVSACEDLSLQSLDILDHRHIHHFVDVLTLGNLDRLLNLVHLRNLDMLTVALR